jgi:hypothetical protein
MNSPRLEDMICRADRAKLQTIIRDQAELVQFCIEDGEADKAGAHARIGAQAALELIYRDDEDDRIDADYWANFSRGFDEGHAGTERA